MKVYKLTDNQASSLEGQKFDGYSYFWWEKDFANPPKKFITLLQVEACTNPQFQWVRDLPLVTYTPENQPNLFMRVVTPIVNTFKNFGKLIKVTKGSSHVGSYKKSR